MRVVLLNQYYAPDEAATAQFLADLGGALAQAGHEVIAICCDRSYADPGHRYPKRESMDGVLVRRVASSGFGRGNPLGRLMDYGSYFAGATWRLLLGPRADVVVSLTTPPFVSGLGVLVSWLRGTRSLFWVMDVYPDLAFELGVLRERTILGRVLKRIADVILRQSDVLIALDDAMASRLRNHRVRDVRVVHNWSDETVVVPKPVDASPFRREWGWDGRFVVLYSGNLGLAHEFETVLGAAERLRSREDVIFAFVGGGPRRDEVARAARDRGLSNVEFRPYVPREKVGDSLIAGDVHLVTLRPGMPGLLVPSKIYGILAAGRPTLYVGPPDGGVAAIVAEGGCGLRIENGDCDGLAAAVGAYAADPARRAAEGTAARTLFDERFSRKRGTGAFIRLIEAIGTRDISV